jgi:hypothetical protein
MDRAIIQIDPEYTIKAHDIIKPDTCSGPTSILIDEHNYIFIFDVENEKKLAVILKNLRETMIRFELFLQVMPIKASTW